MSSPNSTLRSIAFLATGNELISGQILNTNTQAMAQVLHDSSYTLGDQLIVDDCASSIEDALEYLLKKHRVIITLGGLGPTTDDITCESIAKTIEKELVFDPESWEHIKKRLSKGRLANKPIPDSNKKQAYFPQGATILVNNNGTANAAWVEHGEQIIIMLPGPPHECLPIFHEQVIDKLQSLNISEVRYRSSMYYTDASESEVASMIDSLRIHRDCTIGYRASYPYLQIKLSCVQLPLLEQESQRIASALKPLAKELGKDIASDALKTLIIDKNIHLVIDDQLTGGQLALALLSPETKNNIRFEAFLSNPGSKPNNDNDSVYFSFKLTGLACYWENHTNIPLTTQLSIESWQSDTCKNQSISVNMRYQASHCLKQAAQMVSLEILQACWRET